MPSRTEQFLALAQHPWLKRPYNRLLSEESAQALEFCEKNEGLSPDAFDMAVNRLFMDKPKSKNWTTICELLCAVSGLEIRRS